MITPEMRAEMETIAKQQAEATYNRLGTMFGLAKVPRHIHNGYDSPHLPSTSIHPFYQWIYFNLPGTSAATAANYGVFWTAPEDGAVILAWEFHQTKGTDASAVTLQIERLTGTEAPGAGVDMLASTFDLKGTINTKQEQLAAITNTSGAKDAWFKRGDRLCMKDSGTLTAVANVTVGILISIQ